MKLQCLTVSKFYSSNSPARKVCSILSGLFYLFFIFIYHWSWGNLYKYIITSIWIVYMFDHGPLSFARTKYKTDHLIRDQRISFDCQLIAVPNYAWTFRLYFKKVSFQFMVFVRAITVPRVNSFFMFSIYMFSLNQKKKTILCWLCKLYVPRDYFSFNFGPDLQIYGLIISPLSHLIDILITRRFVFFSHSSYEKDNLTKKWYFITATYSIRISNFI